MFTDTSPGAGRDVPRLERQGILGLILASALGFPCLLQQVPLALLIEPTVGR